MAETRNFLLGFGERLTEKIDPVRRPVTKADPYKFAEARDRLAPRIKSAVREIESLPQLACPHDECVAAVTLHPAYIAKSFFPAGLLRTVGLESVGSKPRQVIPEKGAKKQTAAERKEGIQPVSATADLFVAGTRQAFRQWAAGVERWQPSRDGAAEIIRVEDYGL